MRTPGAILALVLWVMPDGSSAALELDLPGQPTLSAEVIRNPDSYMLPVGPWTDGRIPTTQVSGRVLQQAWRLQASGITTGQIIAPLRKQVTDLGYEILLDCSGRQCGGFDFRFETRILPAPDMFVDLFDYRFLAARKRDGPEGEAISILVSRSAGTGYVQLIQVTPPGGTPVPTRPADSEKETARSGVTELPPVAEEIESEGHVILRDLEFETGSAQLGPGPFPSLVALAEYLRANPSRRIAVVGHTDSTGTLETNISLSRQRASEVMARLVEKHGIPAGQLESGGMGYLAPVAPNVTGAGREANRRVEAVLVNSE